MDGQVEIEDDVEKESADDVSDFEEIGKATRRKRKQKKVDTDDDDGSGECQVQSRALASRRAASSRVVGSVRQRTKHAANSRSKDTDSESDDDHNEMPEIKAVREADCTAPAPLRDEDLEWGLKELNNSLCDHLDEIIQSKECAFGAVSFERMLRFHKLYPCSESRKKLIDLLLHGPIGHNKNTRFPDAQRTLLARKVIECLLSVSGMHDKFAADFVALGWEACLAQMTRPIFAAEGDEQRVNQDAIRRVADSLYVKAHFMEFFAEILQHEQKRCSPSSDSVMRKCLLGVIARTGHAGSSGALQSAVEVYIHLLIQRGHLVVGVADTLCSAPDGPSYTCLAEARAAAERLYRALGKVVSILAWLFIVLESKTMVSVSHTIGQMLLGALRSTTFDPTPFLEEPDTLDYWQSIKMKFILGLDRELAPQLRPLLAEKLSIAEDYNTIFA